MIRWRAAFSIVVLVVDVVLKVIARWFPNVSGNFSFSTPIGPVGFSPSVNGVFAFSIPIPNAVIWPVGWVIVAVLIRALVRTPRRRAAITAIILGACSNLVERTFLGGVTDYLSATDLAPAWNLADALVVGGVVMWLRDPPRPRETSNVEHPPRGGGG